MILFPAWFFEGLVWAAIGLTVVGTVTLFILFARDLHGKEIW